MSGICRCSNPIVSDSRPPCTKAGCLRIPHVYVKQIDSVYPCNETLIIDLSNKIHFDPNQLKSITEISIISHSSNLRDVTLIVTPDRSSIELQVTSNYPGYPSPDYKFATLVWRVRQGLLSDESTITIPFKSHCNTVDVPADKYCDACTGNLLNKQIDISVIPNTPNGVLDISVTPNLSGTSNEFLDISVTTNNN